LKSLSIITNW